MAEGPATTNTAVRAPEGAADCAQHPMMRTDSR